MSQQFEVCEIDGEDEEKGNLWFEILETTEREELAVVMLRDAERIELEQPGTRQRKLDLARWIANAMTEYAKTHPLR